MVPGEIFRSILSTMPTSEPNAAGVRDMVSTVSGCRSLHVKRASVSVATSSAEAAIPPVHTPPIASLGICPPVRSSGSKIRPSHRACGAARRAVVEPAPLLPRQHFLEEPRGDVKR